MATVNKVILIGNLTRDPELTWTPSQTAVSKFGMALNERYTDSAGQRQERVSFVDLVSFGKIAETLSQYVRKGDPLYVEGKLRMEQWEDKTSGQRRQKLSVLVDQFQFLKGKGEEQHEQAPSGAPPQRRPSSGPNGHTAYRSKASAAGNAVANAKPQRQPAPLESPFPDDAQFKDDDIPF